MEKIIKISGREVGFRASALTPKLYRIETGRDLLLDLARMSDAIKNGSGSIGTLSILDDFAYILARSYAKTHGLEIEATVDEWLDQFELADIYEIYPELVQLWAQDAQTTSVPQKKTRGKR